MNIYDVSEKAGVSIATVSRVINGNEKVSPRTRERVVQVIKELGYTPNIFARGLGLNTMHTIGIMCADSSDAFMAKAIYYLEQELRKNHYDVLLCCTGYQIADKKNYLDLLLSKRTDAIILVGSNFVEDDSDDNNYILEAAKEVPMMLVNGLLKGENVYSTLCDDYQAVFNATTWLTHQGYEKILYIYNRTSSSSSRKISGYTDAIKAKQLTPYVHLINVDASNGLIRSTFEQLQQLHDEGLQFDAVMASNDPLGVGALKYAKKQGYQIPENFSVIGYNNSTASQCSEPELTTIDNRLETLCKSCVDTLMSVFNNESVPGTFYFPAKLIKRGTTKL